MDIQIAALKKIPCFKDIVIYRPGYAIEYDFFDPTQLSHTLESKIIKNLYFAGQVNGTTGYEEAAGQGLVAGINAALSCNGKETFTLRRDEAYIGVLIDDLVTKGVDEPYRMFTSRAEYRILLRQDNADSRLTPYAEKYGLATAERIHRKNFKEGKVNNLIELCKNVSVKPNEINAFLTEKGTSELKGSSKVYELLTRPQITLEELCDNVPFLKTKCDGIIKNDKEIMDCAEIEIKYSGYIHREKEMAEKMQRLENIKIKNRFNYQDLKEISTEGRQKLSAINPETLGQASRIPGVSPSDISVLLILLGR